MKFFELIDGKERPCTFNKKEMDEYKERCLTIWGAAPYDVTWATGTALYLSKILQRY